MIRLFTQSVLFTLIFSSSAALQGVYAQKDNKLKAKPDADSYRQAVLASRPAGYWRLGEPRDSSVAIDSSGNKHDGRYHGKVNFGQPGALPFDKDTAIGLDGPRSKSYVEVPANKDFSVASSGKGLTVEVWLRPDALIFQGETNDADPHIHWLGKGEAKEFEWGFRFYNKKAERSNRISAYIWNPGGGLGAGAYIEDVLVERQWIYLVATFDDPRTPGARVQIFKNGVPGKHNTSKGTRYESYGINPKAGKAPLRLGTRDLKSFLTGGLDEIAIYPRVLPADEIMRHWVAARRNNRGQD